MMEGIPKKSHRYMIGGKRLKQVRGTTSAEGGQSYEDLARRGIKIPVDKYPDGWNDHCRRLANILWDSRDGRLSVRSCLDRLEVEMGRDFDRAIAHLAIDSDWFVCRDGFVWLSLVGKEYSRV
jgi:hypothetical protein